MSLPLFIVLFKKNWKILLIFAVLNIFYMSAIALMATSEMMISSMDFLNMGVNQKLIADIDIAVSITSSVFQGMIMYIFIMVYYVIMAGRLVHKLVDNSSITGYLTAGVSRTKFIITSAVWLISSVFALYLIVWAVSAICLLTYGSFNFGWWTVVHIVTFLCSLSVAMISFAFSAVFAGTKQGSTLLSGIPIAFAVLMMLGSYIKFFKWLAPFGWVDSAKLAEGNFPLWWVYLLIYLAISAIAFVYTVIAFRKKQLSI
ncbi:MAG: hypothetical protein FWD49_02265 [Firmicutes bacterium]|nr:hypothetical protein [Bacillota bacterium]